MRKENCIRLLFAGIGTLLLMCHSIVSAVTTCTAPDEVESAGYCWKDRNLGASQVAESSVDTLAYGDLYQWGRLGDGHQNRNSGTIAVSSADDVPGHSDYIAVSAYPEDWRDPRNNNLWQGLGGVNNPCPQGFRLPTETELNAERLSWTEGNNANGAFESPLHFVMSGYRGTLNDNTSMVRYEGTSGGYWSSTVNGIGSMLLLFNVADADFSNGFRVYGRSVRCLKD